MSKVFNNFIEMCNLEKFSNGENIVLQARNETGTGIMTIYDVLDEIQIIYNDFHMQKIKSEFLSSENILCIDHCREGRIEQEVKKGACSYIQAGDLKINPRKNHNGDFYFSLEHFHGMTIVLDVELADKSIFRMFPDFPFKIAEIKQKFCSKKDICFLRKNEIIEHIFSELYAIPSEIKKYYMQIKVFELLLYLGTIQNCNNNEPVYFYKTQTEKVKELQKYLKENLQTHDTLETLSEKFDIPLTTMKSCFKEMFGSPIYSYLRTLRMNKACELLLFTEDDISKICGEVGYDSPSKFSAAFKKEIGELPMGYRKRKRSMCYEK